MERRERRKGSSGIGTATDRSRTSLQLIQNVADAIDGASVCLLDASNFKVIVNEHGDRNGHPISPKSGPDKAWLHDDLTVNLDIGASDDVRVAHIGTSPLPETLAHGSSAHTPYRFFRPRAAGHQEAMVRAMQSSLADGQRWWSSTAIEDTYLVDLLERSPGSSRHVLIVPAWGSKGSPAVVLAMAFDTMPTDRADIEAFAKSIMTGVINRLSLRRAQSLEQEDETFLAMQPHELRTPLHQL